MNKTTLDMVREFHTKFNAVTKETPTFEDDIVNNFRVDFLQEELDELKEAIANNDYVETLDALIDLQYVLDGTFLALGFHTLKDEGFDEVHRSNMSKLGADGNPILREEDGKILKGPNYFKPDLAKILFNKFPHLKKEKNAA